MDISVLPKLDKIFSTFEISEVVKSDNEPPFQGHTFYKFANFMGFKHRKITPLWPKANGEAKQFMRTLGKAIRMAHA